MKFVLLSLLLNPIFSTFAYEVGEKIESLSVDQTWNFDLEENKLNLIERNDEITIVEVWAPWCGPCIEMMPHLNELQIKYRDQLKILAVTRRDSYVEMQDIQQFVNSKISQINFSILVASEVRSSQFSGKEKPDENTLKLFRPVKAIPFIYVLNKDKEVLWSGNPGARTRNGQLAIDYIVEQLIPQTTDEMLLHSHDEHN